LARELRYGRVSLKDISHHTRTNKFKGRGNIFRRPLPRRRDRLQLRERSAEQERFVDGQALRWLQ
jgi:hypothetical protein